MVKKKSFSCSNNYCLNLSKGTIFPVKMPQMNTVNSYPKKDFNSMINLSLIIDRWHKDRWDEEGKIIENISVSTNKVAKYDTMSLLDTASQVSLIDDNLVNLLKAEDQVNCNESLRIKDLSGDLTNACLIRICIKYRNVNEPCDFFVVSNLKNRVGAPLLIGSDIIKKEKEISGNFLVFPEDNENIKFKLERKKNFPIHYKPTIKGIKGAFKEFGNFQDVAEKFNLSANQVYNAIQRDKRFRNDAEYCCWVLSKQAKINTNWWEDTIEKFQNYFMMRDAHATETSEKKGGKKQRFALKEKMKSGMTKIAGSKVGKGLKKAGSGVKKGVVKGASLAKEGIQKGAKKIREGTKKAGAYAKKKISEQASIKKGIFPIEIISSQSWNLGNLREAIEDDVITRLEAFGLKVKFVSSEKEKSKEKEKHIKLGQLKIIISHPGPKRKIGGGPWIFVGKVTFKLDGGRLKIKGSIQTNPKHTRATYMSPTSNIHPNQLWERVKGALSDLK